MAARMQGDSRECDVVVIGGGFAGLSISLLLKQRGLKSVILEKSERVGGKSRTLNLHGNVIELGTCFTARDYRDVVALAEQYGVRTQPLGRASASPESVLGALYTKRIATRFNSLSRMIAIMSSLQRYARERRKALARFDARVASEYAALAMPALDWLRRHRCQALEPVFLGVGDVYGYGPMKTMPALYALRWVTPEMVITAFTSTAKRLDVGFGELAERIAEETEIWRSQTLTHASRTPNGAWSLSTPGNSFNARHVVVACAPKSSELLELFDPTRRRIIENHVVSTPYFSVLVKAAHWFTNARRAFLRAGDHRDQLMIARNDGPADDGGSYYVCFLCPTIADTSHIEAILDRAIARDGGVLREIVEIRGWGDYMSRLDADAIGCGSYATLEDLQGAENVWLSNSILAHENWRDLLALNKRITDAICAASQA